MIESLPAFFDEFEKIGFSAADLEQLLKEAGFFSNVGEGIAKHIRQSGGMKNLAPVKAVRRMVRGVSGGMPGAAAGAQRYAPGVEGAVASAGKGALPGSLSARARAGMERMTGHAGGASIPQTAEAQRLTQALTGSGSPELMTEMHGMGKLLSSSEQAAKQQAKQHFEGVLKSQGKLYKGTPGLEAELGQIGGHPATITRTPAKVIREEGTVASRPSALRRTQAKGATPAAPTAEPLRMSHPGTPLPQGTALGVGGSTQPVYPIAPLARRVPSPAQRQLGTMQTAVAPINPWGQTAMAGT